VTATVVVIGAGLSGLVAAGELMNNGHHVIVLDKGRSPGGRLATRRIGDATFDHGAQFFTVRSPQFQNRVDQWVDAGLVDVWCRGFAGRDDGHARYATRGGMNALAKHLASGVDVRVNTLAFAVNAIDGRWSVQDDTDTRVTADAVVITTPVPQAMSLLIEHRTLVPRELWEVTYHPTLGLLVAIDGDSAVPAPGGVQDGDELFSMISDNRAKGISTAGALTFHANSQWSHDHYDRPNEELHDELLAAAQRWIGDATVVETQLKKWRFATPKTLWPEPCCPIVGGPGPLVLAGDAYGSAKVEGAYLSGWAAAQSVMSSLSS
jgi:renalase